MLSQRAETILKSIVGRYIVGAVPVASETIAHEHELSVSPATIRNEMARLEQNGYITRDYPSAGSVPSDKGYRFYVETLNDLELPLAEQFLINHLFHQVEMEQEKWLSLAATLLARLARNAAIVATPKPVDGRFKYLELVALQDSLVLVILILRGARVKQQLTTFGQVVSQPELISITNKLNAAYSGLTRRKILEKTIELLPNEQQITDCVVKIMQDDDEREFEESYFDGLHFVLNQPEFAQSHQMLDLMELIEHRNLLKIITPQGRSSQGVQVVIGKENKAEIIQNYSVVISQYGLPEEAVGTISVVGPTRMPYARIISTVGYLSSVLTALLAELYGIEKS
ncbi:heat-inducible transcriptional repressor HrcA [Chloroflexota bacterium]